MENENKKVKVISSVNFTVTVKEPNLRFSRQWHRKGAAVMIEQETLAELIYDPGFRNMLEDGTLYIEDLEVKKELGLEPDDATEAHVIYLDDKTINRYLKLMPLYEFKEQIKKLSVAQVSELAEAAIAMRFADLDKSAIIKTVCGKDIIRSIQLNDADKEA